MTDTAPLKKALLMIQKLKKLLQEQQHPLFEPIAIVGMGCRLPQADHPQAFWNLLCEGKQVISPIPEARWELLKGTSEAAQRDNSQPYWGGYLTDIAAFDAYFFGISPREAMRMDPQQRLLLEVTYASFEDAGLTVEALAGSKTGVFSSIYSSQYGHLQSQDSDVDALFIPTGNAVSIAANRLSYMFDLHGPSMTIDTACSSSLIAVQIACLHLQAKLCDQAVVNAANINLLPSVHTLLAKANMLSPTGQCQTFDANANGYVQGEGACSIVLKPLSKALKDKDRVHAVIAGGAMNQDGRTNGLTAPNGKQQEQLLQAAYRSAKVDSNQMAYVECHGTGTFLGDPIEAQALGEVIGKQRPTNQPCWIGSVKTNVGHLEPAAGLVSLIKVALALKHRMIPPHLNVNTPNPHIAFERYGLNIPQHIEPFPKYGDVRVGGISGFGFGGANAHLVLRELTAEERSDASPIAKPIDVSSRLSAHSSHTDTGLEASTFRSELFTLSAKHLAALEDLIGLWCDFIEQNRDMNITQLCHNMHLKRSHYSHRIAIITHSTEDLYQKLLMLRASPQTTHEDIHTHPAGQYQKNNLTIDAFDTMSLATLATHYVHQATINWHVYEAHRSYPTIDMPLYPWQRKVYWPTFTSPANTPSHMTHPLRARRLSSPLSAHQFEFIVDTVALPEMADTFYVLHAGFYLEMLHYAVQHLHTTTGFHVDDLTFASPLVVSPGKTACIQLILNAHTSSFDVYCHDGNNHWLNHANGGAITAVSSIPSFEVPTDLRHHHTGNGSQEHFYERIINMGMPAGNTVRWIHQYWCNQNTIFCELRAPTEADRCQLFSMSGHPGLIDACIQTFFLLLPSDLAQPYVTSHMGRLSLYRGLSEATYVYAVIKEIAPQGDRLVGDWYLLDQNQHMIASCTDICLSQLGNTLSIGSIMDIQTEYQLDATLPYHQCKQQVQDHLIQQVALIFSMPMEDVPVNLSLLDLGMDSLVALAVIRMVESSFHITLSLPTLMNHLSIEDITQIILKDRYPDVGKTEQAACHKQDETIWVFNRKPQAESNLRLFCFPFGGGGASIYRDWQTECRDTIEVCPVQLPGRENRMDETPIHDMRTLVSCLADHLLPFMDKPFAFFGHSLGALIAFELTRYLRQHHQAQPIHLFASAYPDPREPSKSLNHLLFELEQHQIHLFDLYQSPQTRLSQAELTILADLLKKNGLVDYGDERMNQDIINVLLPIFINDMKLAKQYSYEHQSPLDLPITACSGQRDTWVLPEEMQGWAQQSTQSCEFLSFDSGHLFIKEPVIRRQLIQAILQRCELK